MDTKSENAKRLDALIAAIRARVERYPAVYLLEKYQQRFYALQQTSPATLTNNAKATEDVVGAVHDYHVRKRYETKQAQFGVLHDRLKDLSYALAELSDRPEAIQTVDDCFTAAEDAVGAIK